MHTNRWMLAAAGLLALSLAANHAARADTPVLQTTFESDTGDWKLVNPSGGDTDAAKLSVAHEAANIKDGKGSLKFEYTIKKGDTNLLYLPVAPPALSKAKSIHFWIKPDHPTSFVLMVHEKDGDQYQTAFTAAGDAWQEISVALSDLAQSTDNGAPKDPDKKVNPDQIENLALMDADCFLAQQFGDATPFINLPGGKHTLYMSPFTISPQDLPAVPAPAAGETKLTPLIRPQADWIVIGDAAVTKATEKPFATASVKAAYTVSKGKITGLIKPVKPGTFTGAKQLCFSAASKTAVSLRVQVEETDGGKYQTEVMVPGDGVAKEFSLNLADFAVAEDSKDQNDKLDLELIKQVVIVDITGFGDTPDIENNLLINNLRAVK